MLRARTKTPPPSRWRLPALLSASVLLVAVTGVFTYAKFRNDAARRRVDAACSVIREAEQERAAAMANATKLSAGNGDAEKVANIEKLTRQSRLCEPLHAQLSGHRWNFGRRWSPPPIDPAALPSREEIAAIGARARPRCVAQVGMFLGMLGSSSEGGPSAEKRQELLDLCDLEKQSAKALSQSGEARQPLRLLDEWPAALEGVAAGVAAAPHPQSSGE